MGTIVGMLAQGKLDSWEEALIGIGVGLLFALLFSVGQIHLEETGLALIPGVDEYEIVK